jgi:hypothetical protein
MILFLPQALLKKKKVTEKSHFSIHPNVYTLFLTFSKKFLTNIHKKNYLMSDSFFVGIIYKICLLIPNLQDNLYGIGNSELC